MAHDSAPLDMPPAPAASFSRGRLLGVVLILVISAATMVVPMDGEDGLFAWHQTASVSVPSTGELWSGEHRLRTWYGAATSGTTFLHVRMAGTPCAGLWPRVGVEVDGVPRLQLTVPGPGEADLYFPLALSRGRRLVSLSLLNDDNLFPEDVDARVTLLSVGDAPDARVLPVPPAWWHATVLPFGRGEYALQDARVVLAGGWVSQVVWIHGDQELPVTVVLAEPVRDTAMSVSLNGVPCARMASGDGLRHGFQCSATHGVAEVRIRHEGPVRSAASVTPLFLSAVGVGKVESHPPTPPTLSAEGLVFHPGKDGAVVNGLVLDGTWALRENGTWSVSFVVPSWQPVRIGITLSGSADPTRGPWTYLMVDRRQVGRFNLTEQRTTHTVRIALPAGEHTALLAFVKDGLSPPSNHTLRIQRLEVD